MFQNGSGTNPEVCLEKLLSVAQPKFGTMKMVIIAYQLI